MKTLIVEDDFICRKILQTQLAGFGSTDIAVNGVEAIEAVAYAIANNEPYDLICLDILMPEMDGHEVLDNIRHNEQECGIHSTDGVKIIMTTSLKDIKTVSKSYIGLCDEYLAKPVDKEALYEKLKVLGLIE